MNSPEPDSHSDLPPGGCVVPSPLPAGLAQHGGPPAVGPDGPIQAAAAVRRPTARPPNWLERLEAWASRLSIKNNFWHKAFSLVWLPYAFRSGIKMHDLRKGFTAKNLSTERFAAILPFRRFNRNFYDAMAGAALLGNSEVAAGMYLFSVCGGDYTVVCKEMRYRFLRPCLGPAIYRVVKSQDVEEKVVAGGEFNVALELEVYQQPITKKHPEILVGRCDITFHCTPKSMVRERAEKRRARNEKRAALARVADDASRVADAAARRDDAAARRDDAAARRGGSSAS